LSYGNLVTTISENSFVLNVWVPTKNVPSNDTCPLKSVVPDGDRAMVAVPEVPTDMVSVVELGGPVTETLLHTQLSKVITPVLAIPMV
jgi:hypothetical protein